MSISMAQRARLGVFMIVGIVLLAVFIAVPVGVRLRDTHVAYYASFEGESLSGLEQGATVKFHGIPIGKVEELSYNPDNINTVRVRLKIEEDFPMKTDMYAQTGMMGITGLMYVEILGGSNEAPVMEPGSEIPTKRSMISTVTGKAEAIVGKVELLLNHLTRITHPDSLQSAKLTLDNVAAISEDARRIMGDLRPDIKNMTGSTKSILASVDSIAVDMKALTRETRESLREGRLTQIMTSIDSTARSLSALSVNMDLMLRQSREDIRISLENLKETLENANQLSKALAENPSLLLRGEQQRERIIR